MNLNNKIKIHTFTYITLLLSFLSGYFEYVFLLLLFIIIHEFGHILMSSFLNFKINEINIFPFGGQIILDNKLNSNINKEVLVMLSGPLVQICLYLLLLYFFNKNFISEITFEKIRLIHYLLLSFNMLPIVPLDGSKLLVLMLEKIIPYKLSNKISIIVSVLTIFFLLITNRKIFVLMISLLLIKNIYFEIKELNIKYNKLLLERLLYEFNFKKVKLIKNVKKIYKNKRHYINSIEEKEYLKNYFKTK